MTYQKAIGSQLTVRGKTKTITEWSRHPDCVVPSSTIWQRLGRGWSAEAAVFQPPRQCGAEEQVRTFFQRNSDEELSIDDIQKKFSVKRSKAYLMVGQLLADGVIGQENVIRPGRMQADGTAA